MAEAMTAELVNNKGMAPIDSPYPSHLDPLTALKMFPPTYNLIRKSISLNLVPTIKQLSVHTRNQSKLRLISAVITSLHLQMDLNWTA